MIWSPVAREARAAGLERKVGQGEDRARGHRAGGGVRPDAFRGAAQGAVRLDGILGHDKVLAGGHRVEEQDGEVVGCIRVDAEDGTVAHLVDRRVGGGQKRDNQTD